MMAAKAGCLSTLAAVVLVFVNIIVLLVCLTLLSLGIWAVASPSTLSNAIQTLPYLIVKVLLPREVITARLGAGLAALAAFVACIAAMGLRGAVNRSQFLLFMYASLVLLLLLLECALFYYFSDLMQKGLQIQDGQWTHIVRLAFSCCEYNSSLGTEVSRPWSCCGVNGYPENCTTQLAYDKDCKETISTWLDRYQTIIYIALAAVHIILSSCSLLRRRRIRASHSYS